MFVAISRRTRVLSWIVQAILALLFVFAGGMKLALPIQVLSGQTGLPGGFMKFIGLAELAGGLGLVLPGLFGVQRQLTRLAAAGLVLIMAGAVVVSVLKLGLPSAVVPFAVGVLLVTVVRGPRDAASRRASPPRLTLRRGPATQS